MLIANFIAVKPAFHRQKDVVQAIDRKASTKALEKL